jgi:hypothetical protein
MMNIQAYLWEQLWKRKEKCFIDLTPGVSSVSSVENVTKLFFFVYDGKDR